ncbi:MAG: Wzt carbohydrate-binding domain-containing protein, partial [Planctomycetales bacterium]
SRSEIMRRFDEIVDFSGVERFLDTPVKRYSSGMRVRLAFAVAAHLEPEMLLVDEVLAVGDAQFQRKCLGKMSEVADSGRTVMFVSHNMAAVQRLCKRGILLQDSQVAADGDVETVVQQYLSQFEQQARVEPALRTDRGGRGDARLTRVEIENPSSDRHSIPRTGDPLRLSFYFDRRLPYMSCAFTLYDLRGGPIANFNSRWQGQGIVQSSDGEARIVCDVPELLVLPGRYRLNVSVSAADVAVDKLDAAAVFDVEEGDVRGQAVPRSTAYGSCYFPHAWTSDDEQRRSAPGAEAFPIEDVPACG